MKENHPLWLRLLPASLRLRIGNRGTLINAVSNAGWLFGDRALRMGVGLFVSVWVARYLGPEQFGQFNYAIAFVSLFGAIAALGLNGIVVRDIVRSPDDANVTLGTAFLMQIIGGIAAVALIIGVIAWLRPDDVQAKVIVSILGFTLVFKSSEVVKYWFESQVQSRYTVWVENTVFLIGAALKVAMILSQAPLIAFVWILFAEAALTAAGLFGVYIKRENKLGQWSIKLERGKSLLKDSWPLLLSGIAVIVYIRIDQIMLGEMLGDSAVGIYTSATRVTELFYMLPVILAQTLYPTILKNRAVDYGEYTRRFQSLLRLTTRTSFLIVVVVFLLSDFIVGALYGEQYAGASDVLEIHILMCVFVFMGVVGSSWYLAENVQHLSLYRTLIGATANILFNMAFIPLFGVRGAVAATLVSVLLSDYVFDVFSKRTRPLFYLKTKSLFY